MYFDSTIAGEQFLILARKTKYLSDRDTLIIITSYIDDFICRLLRERLIHNDKKQLWFERYDFLLINRLRLAYSVGLISRDMFDELTFIVKMRNIFAHCKDNDFLESENSYSIFSQHMAYSRNKITAIEEDIDAVISELKISREELSNFVDEKFKYKTLLCVVAAFLNSTSGIKRLEYLLEDYNVAIRCQPVF